MNIEHLLAHGFRTSTIDNWKRLGVTQLLPLQQRALTHTRLLTGYNVVVFSPTSSGKTFVAELAAVRYFEQGRKSVFLVPTKALAEEQYAHLTRSYAPLGARVVVATRDRIAQDNAIIRGDFDLAVMVYEKFKAFLTLAPELLSRISLVAVDELQILGEPERGDTVDLLLTSILASEHNVQLLCLSAVLAENTRLAAWLRADTLVWRERPVELREGVFRISDGQFTYREANSQLESTEPLLQSGAGDIPPGWAILPDARHYHYPAVSALAGTFARRGESTLVFVPTRRTTMEWALRLGGDLQLPPIGNVDALLSQLEDSYARTRLCDCLQAGVAFHNSDLPPDVRRLVEEQFNAGNIRILVATSTLAQGVNVKCRNVISVPVMLHFDAASGKAVAAPLSVQRFRNQGGRAGRFHAGEELGRSILIAEDEAEAERLMRDFVYQDVEPLEPAIASDTLQRLALNLLHTGRARTREELNAALQETYSAEILWNARPHELEREVARAVAQLETAALLQATPDGRLVPSGIGQIAATYGLAPATAILFADACREHRDSEVTPLEILALCAISPDGATFQHPPTHQEFVMQHYPQLLASRHEFRMESKTSTLQSLLHPAGGFPVEAHHALKKAFVCEAWLSSEATAEVEERFLAFSGTIANLAAHFSWLAQALSACMATLGSVEASQEILKIAERLPLGIPERALPLARLNAQGLSRNFVAALLREGYDTPASIRQASLTDLTRVLPRAVAEQLLHAAHEAAREKSAGGLNLFAASKTYTTPAPAAMDDLLVAEAPAAATTRPAESTSSLPAERVVLEVDPRRPGEILFRDQRLKLTPKQYHMVRLLAEHSGHTVSYQDIDQALWPDAQVEPRQRSAHKQALLRQLAQVCGAEEAQNVVITEPHYGLRLNLPPSSVRLTLPTK